MIFNLHHLYNNSKNIDSNFVSNDFFIILRYHSFHYFLILHRLGVFAPKAVHNRDMFDWIVSHHFKGQWVRASGNVHDRIDQHERNIGFGGIERRIVLSIAKVSGE